ncbi:MAG TPA: 30S ribosomal protein S20 [Polyangiaceae bacterium]
MANHPSAEKRNRQRVKRTLRNRAVKSAVRTQVKTVRTAIESKDPAAAQKAFAEASVTLAQAAAKGSIPKKTASRRISRLASALHGLTKKA